MTDVPRNDGLKIIVALQKYDVKSTGDNKWKCRCPCHDDHKPNLHIEQRPDGTIVMHCFVCNANGSAVCKTLGIPESAMFSNKLDVRQRPAKTTNSAKPKTIYTALPTHWMNNPITTWYDYPDAEGIVSYKVARTNPKTDFPPVSQVEGGWSWGLNGHPRLLYRLPQLLVLGNYAPDKRSGPGDGGSGSFDA